MKATSVALVSCLLMISCAPAPQVEQSARQVVQPADYPTAKATYPFSVKVRDFFGAEGFGYDYYVSDDSIVVVLWDDFGSPRREVLKRNMSPAEQRLWEEFLASFPLQTLKDEYLNAHVFDGLQRTFTFCLDGNERVIEVKNCHVPELGRLCVLVNKFLPEDLQIHGGGSGVYTLSDSRVIPEHHRLFADAFVDLLAKSYPEFESLPDDEHLIRFIHAQSRDMHSLLKSFIETHPTDDPELLNAMRKLDDVTVQEFDLHAKLIAEGRFTYGESEMDMAKKVREESAVLAGTVGEFVLP